MPIIGVHYLGFLQQLVGTIDEQVELPPAATVGDLVAELGHRHGADLTAALLTGSGRLRESSRIFVGDVSAGDMGGMDAPLPGHGEVIVAVGMFPITGG